MLRLSGLNERFFHSSKLLLNQRQRWGGARHSATSPGESHSPIAGNNRDAFRVDSSEIRSTGTLRSSASFSATSRTRAGSFREPRNGCGERYGESVSVTYASDGTATATSGSARAFLNVTGPANETIRFASMPRCMRATSPEKQCKTPIGLPELRLQDQSLNMFNVSSSASRLCTTIGKD